MKGLAVYAAEGQIETPRIGEFSRSRAEHANLQHGAVNLEESLLTRKADSTAGVTLWELCVTIMLVGIIIGMGAPGLHRFVLDARLVADVNAFVGAVQLARSEAAKRGRSVIVCKTVDRVSCGGNDIGFDAGWMVFVNADDVAPPTRAANEPLIFAHSPASAGTIVSNRAYYEFRAYRRRSTNGTVTFCDARGPSAARAVIISYTGRPRVAALGPGNRPLICA